MTTSRYRFCYSEAKNANGTAWLGTQQTQLVSLFSPQYVVSAETATHTHIHTLPSTIPLYYRCLCGVTPAWTAYVPPRGAAAACSGSSSAAGCSRCCSAEGHMRQTMTTEGKTAIKQQIKPVQKYQENIQAWARQNWSLMISLNPSDIRRAAANEPCRYFSIQVTMELLLSDINATLWQSFTLCST